MISWHPECHNCFRLKQGRKYSKPHSGKDEIMTWRTNLEIETMEYVQFMSPILSTTIGPTGFSNKILSARNTRTDINKTEQHEEHT